MAPYCSTIAITLWLLLTKNVADAFVPLRPLSSLSARAAATAATHQLNVMTVPEKQYQQQHHLEETNMTEEDLLHQQQLLMEQWEQHNHNNDVDDVNDDGAFKMPPRRWKTPVHEDVCAQTGITLSRYMMELSRANPQLKEVESIFSALQVACKTISKMVRTAALTGQTGYHDDDTINAHGEQQKKLDVEANNVLKDALRWTGKLDTIASEEEEEPVNMKKQRKIIKDNRGNPVYSNDVLVDNVEGSSYIAVFDPLDGSSNIDAGIPVGTIFGIFEQSKDDCDLLEDNSYTYFDADHEQGDDDSTGESLLERNCIQGTLQPGKQLVAAGYCLYSSATTLVFTLGNGVHGFTLDESIGEFVLTHSNMTIPDRGNIYSFNEANRWEWDAPMQEYITDIQQGNGDTQTKYTSRYVGSMVADVHRTLQYGGVFGYPADSRNPDGKLRLLYEAAPMAFIVEQAGGRALTGRERIMDVPPTHIHQRVPCILGSRGDVKELRRYYEENTDPELIARCEARMHPADDNCGFSPSNMTESVDGFSQYRCGS